MDDSWEEAVDDLEFGIERCPNKKLTDIKIEILHKIVWCIQVLLTPVNKPNVKGNIDIHIKNELEEHVRMMNVNERDKNIILFKFLILFKIPCRIYFVLSECIECFIEVEILNKIIQKHKKYSHCIISIDGLFRIVDQSHHFSTSMKYYSYVRYIIDSIDIPYKNIFNLDENMFKSFSEIDKIRINKIPNSINKFKKHPKYVIESLLKWNEYIYPKRPILGYFKGEAVYPRENVIELKTKKQMYKLGKIINSPIPCKIIKRKDENIELYAIWQTTDLVVNGFSDSLYQDYFHPNFIPKDCVYINSKHDKEVAYLLRIPYRICFCGFSQKNPINEGIFIEKRNFYKFSNFLFQYCNYVKLKTDNKRRTILFKKWRYLIKNVIKYLKIKGMLNF